MSENGEQSVLLLGGLDAGKSNFLGRLWIALDAEQGVVAKNGLPSQVEYLRGLAASLNEGVFTQRSAPGTFEPTSIPVKWRGGERHGNLVVPDCAGELWEKIHNERCWDDRWEQTVRTMSGCILFFRGSSDHNVPALNWSDHAEVMECLKAAKKSKEAGEMPKLPTQVMAVDWLQCLSTAFRDRLDRNRPLRIAVVLSAWDMAQQEARKADPDNFLSDNLPLLHDFLSGNPERFTSRTFGVSISGGPLTTDDTKFMKEYLKKGPSQAGFVELWQRGKVASVKDLTLPLAWAFGCECSELA